MQGSSHQTDIHCTGGAGYSDIKGSVLFVLKFAFSPFGTKDGGGGYVGAKNIASEHIKRKNTPFSPLLLLKCKFQNKRGTEIPLPL